MQAVFEDDGSAPKREFKTIKEFQAYFKDEETLIIDGTEQQIERPKEKELQKQNYSGKKKLSSCPRGTPLKLRSSRVKI